MIDAVLHVTKRSYNIRRGLRKIYKDIKRHFCSVSHAYFIPYCCRWICGDGLIVVAKD